MRPRTLACLLLVTCLGRDSLAATAGRPALEVRTSSTPVRVDGVLDDAAWKEARTAEQFLLMTPREGQAPDESTRVSVVRDRDRLVFGIWCQAGRKPHAGLTPRDGVLDGDHISVHLDTDGDGQRAYIFGVNPWGVQLDGILTGDADFKWDGVWDADAQRGAGEWTAEIAVPFRILRISASGRPWRLWVRRQITPWNEVSTWPLYLAGEPGPIMLQAADLTGLDEARGGSELTFEPYVFGASTSERPLEAGGGTGEWLTQDSRDAGFDLQAALSSSMVMNGTYNPDFSQIEADALQIDVNRRFPLRFPEKRQFFMEGADHFLTLMEMVETRRISDPDAGLKTTGRAGAWDNGLLVVRDAGGSTLEGSGYTPSDDCRPTREGWYGLARAKLPFGEGSNVGVLTGAHTQDAPPEPSDASLPRELTTYNAFGGFDSQLRLGERWRTEAQFVVSTAKIDSANALTPPQPFSDWMGVVRFFYRDKAREFHIGERHVGEKFRNEIGYQDFAGVIYRRVGGFWDLFPTGSALQRVSPILDALVVHHHTGRLQFTELLASGDFEFRRNAFVNAGYLHNDEYYLNRLYPQDKFTGYAEWTAWRPVTFSVNATVGDGVLFGPTDETSALAWSESYSLNAKVRPGPRLTAAADVVRYRLADVPGGTDYYALWLVGVNTSVQFTRELSARIYPQYDSYEQHLFVNALLGYILRPGTVFYVGVNSGWDPDQVSQARQNTSRQFFAKASYRFAR